MTLLCGYAEPLFEDCGGVFVIIGDVMRCRDRAGRSGGWEWDVAWQGMMIFDIFRSLPVGVAENEKTESFPLLCHGLVPQSATVTYFCILCHNCWQRMIHGALPLFPATRDLAALIIK
ncbi:hypothetical protein EP30_03825 [Bifidobacterium sp. UTCIF-39]|nr:hypothetical protein EP30_03825 [Bifidobacterium sp. UTCIF-39]